MIAAISARKSTSRTLRILVGLLSLLTFTTSAYAEYAWVLWGLAAGPSGLMAVTLGAWQTRDNCEIERAAEERIRQPGSGKLVCLPDTVDPRGPKGK